MGAREHPTPDLLEDWRRYEKSLLTKLANRERELRELHEDYLYLEQRLNGALGWARRYWAQQDAEIANRLTARAAND